jgi:3-(3-hydroxy-phenyl)propionate hydroxylase
MMQSSDPRVLVVGGGPVGLTAALRLAQKGVPVTVIEREPSVPRDYRAAGFHPSTMDLLEDTGATQALIDRGLVCPVMQYRDRDEGKIVEFDYSLLKNDTRHPFRIQCEGFKLSEWAVTALQAMPNAEVLFSHTLTALKQTDGGVASAIATPDGSELNIEARYLIGADGGRSTVRKSVGINYEGFTYPERILVMGTSFDFKKALDDICLINYVAGPGKSCFIFRLPDLWKIGVPVPDDVDDATATTDEYVQSELQEVFARDEDYDIHFRAVFRVHQRVAESYRSGRVLLAGDAAHVNHPAGGMGLNGGLHDAINLADRIARVWHGSAQESELDGYEVQRRPEAIEAVHKYTDRHFRYMQESNTDKRERIIGEWRKLAESRDLAYQHLITTSMIDSLRRSYER